MQDCPSVEKLRALFSEQVSEDQEQRIAAHLDACASCRESWDALVGEYKIGGGNCRSRNGSLPDFLKGLQQDLPPELVTSTSAAPTLSDSSTADNDEWPTTIGRYQIKSRLGEGGFGRVYMAWDSELKRFVAIKVARNSAVTERVGNETYLAEARTLAKLDHPHIVPVFDVGISDQGLPFVVSKYFGGTDLAKRLKKQRPSHTQSAQWIAVIADALHYAHKSGFVHRDIKPANILLDSADQPIVADFGLAMHEEGFGAGPSFIGTPEYMSPEQARGEGHRVDARTDVYSLGVVFYELLTTQPPFRGANRQETVEQLWQITMQDPRPPRQLDDSIPKEFERICLKAMSKLAADRYTTAKDLADDLREALSHMSTDRPPGRAGETLDAPAVPTSSPSSNTVSIHPKAKLVPKGLRAFDEHDADFFLDLLPGLRDRNGLPEVVQYWKTRIEENDAELTFSVGLIYGPSGCGKSSLIRAGLLPRLSTDVVPVYVEATPQDTEERLRQRLRKQFPELPSGAESLPEIVAALRQQLTLKQETKALIIIDQFEQWLHTRIEPADVQLIRAMRQADGGHIQCLLLVRDDFWMSISRLFDQLEINLDRGKNARALDLFTPEHSTRVLRMFGEAYNRFPASPQALSVDEQNFLNRAVTDLTHDGHVIPVQLSLFADMIKERPWTAATLAECGGAEGVGVRFLEETFAARTALPDLRLMATAARGLLQALLPDRSTDIKGCMRSTEELAAAAGMAPDSPRFLRLIELLDRDLHIITPTERDDSPNTKVTYYQLTHDYLVPALRQWLTQERRKTWQGRAQLCLEDHTRHWTQGHETGFLPSSAEYLQIHFGVPKKKRTREQQSLMRAARWHHGLRWGGSFFALALIATIVFIQQLAHRNNVTLEAVNDLLSASANSVEMRIERLRPFAAGAKPLLAAAFSEATLDSPRKLRAGYGMAAFGDVERDFFLEAIPRAGPEECQNIVRSLASVSNLVAEPLLIRSESKQQPDAARARYAIVAMQLGDTRAAESLVALGPNPECRTAFIHALKNWHGDLNEVAAILQRSSDAALVSALCAALGLIDPNEIDHATKTNLKDALLSKFEKARDSGTHSAADWTLRQWKVSLPFILSEKSPPADPNKRWFVNNQRMIMIRIDAGSFYMGEKDPLRRQVTLTRPYFICDRPVTIELFQKFIEDPHYPAAKKPQDWVGNAKSDSNSPDCPGHMINWGDALLFCNWLSWKESLELCYEQVDPNDEGRTNSSGSKTDTIEGKDWKWHINKRGYRLPTEAEWECACRAGTTTQFSFGDNQMYLANYGAFRQNRSASCASFLPNANGLFDMHGNIFQWCWDGFSGIPVGSLVDPIGRQGGTYRVMRAGCYMWPPESCGSGCRFKVDSTARTNTGGFRVVCDATAPAN